MLFALSAFQSLADELALLNEVRLAPRGRAQVCGWEETMCDCIPEQNPSKAMSRQAICWALMRL